MTASLPAPQRICAVSKQHYKKADYGRVTLAGDSEHRKAGEARHGCANEYANVLVCHAVSGGAFLQQILEHQSMAKTNAAAVRRPRNADC
jgi:hypothetical protein